MTAPALVQKLWNYCNILRDDGLSYGDYVEQLTFLLFLKMADEQSRAPFLPSPDLRRTGQQLFPQQLTARVRLNTLTS
jgi:type I restriction enzyme M protein